MEITKDNWEHMEPVILKDIEEVSYIKINSFVLKYLYIKFFKLLNLLFIVESRQIITF
jgi:hypothetical protein